MANREQIELAIKAELEKRGSRVLNRNAVSALFAAFSDPVGALGRVFLGRQDALEAERAKIEGGIVLDLLCSIDDALMRAADKSSQSGVTIAGEFSAHTSGSGEAIGMHIDGDGPPVNVQTGTRVSVSTDGPGGATGLKISGRGIRIGG